MSTPVLHGHPRRGPACLVPVPAEPSKELTKDLRNRREPLMCAPGAPKLLHPAPIGSRGSSFQHRRPQVLHDREHGPRDRHGARRRDSTEEQGPDRGRTHPFLTFLPPKQSPSFCGEGKADNSPCQEKPRSDSKATGSSLKKNKKPQTDLERKM